MSHQPEHDRRSPQNWVQIGSLVVIGALVLILALAVYRYETLPTASQLAATPTPNTTATLLAGTDAVNTLSAQRGATEAVQQAVAASATAAANAASTQQAQQQIAIDQAFATATQNGILAQSVAEAQSAIFDVGNGNLIDAYRKALHAYRLAPTLESIQALFAVAGAPVPPRIIEIGSGEGQYLSVLVSPDGSKLLLIEQDKATVQDFASGEIITTINLPAGIEWGGLQFNFDGTRLYSGREGGDGATIQIWDALTGQLLLELAIEGYFHRSHLSADGARLLVRVDNELQVRDAADGSLIGTITPFEKEVGFDFYTTADSRFVVTSQTRIDLWDLSTGNYIRNVRPQSDGAHIMSFDPVHQHYISYVDSGHFQIGSLDPSVSIVDFFESGADTYIDPQFSPDGQFVAIATNHGVGIWSVQGEKVREVHNLGEMRKLYYSRDGRLLISSGDRAVHVVDVNTDTLLHRFLSPVEMVNSAISFDGRYIAMWSSDKAVRVWGLIDTSIYSDIPSIANGERPVVPAISPDGTMLAALRPSTDQLAVEVWSLAEKERLFVLEGHTAPIHTLRFSKDGAYILTAASDGTLRAWDVQTGEERWKIETGQASIFAFDISPDSQHILSAVPETERLQVWDVSSGAELWGEDDPGAYWARYTADGTGIVAISKEGGIRLINPENGTEIRRIGDMHGWGQSIVISEDSTKLLVLGAVASLWDITTGTQLADLKISAQLGSFDAAGSRVVTVDNSRAIVWDVATGQILYDLTDHEQPITMAGFNPDGTYLITTSQDSTARLWDAASGVQITMLNHPAPVYSGAFTPDGRIFVTLTDSGTIRLWSLDLQAIIDRVTGILTEQGITLEP